MYILLIQITSHFKFALKSFRDNFSGLFYFSCWLIQLHYLVEGVIKGVTWILWSCLGYLLKVSTLFLIVIVELHALLKLLQC